MAQGLDGEKELLMNATGMEKAKLKNKKMQNWEPMHCAGIEIYSNTFDIGVLVWVWVC